MNSYAVKARACESIPVVSGTSALMQMLAYRRPGGSRTERKFIRHWLEPLGTMADEFGNHWIEIGTGSRVLFSSHTDTVHRTGGSQSLMVKNGLVSIHKRSGSNCLGADCTSGVWLMREMILANVPGVYVFHRDEESGGIGSSLIAKHTPERLRGIDMAIAFDRRGNSDVITHQGSRCCSDAFAESLAAALGMAYAPSDAGIFTDTANYVGLIGECTNISVGYYGEHSASETQDIAHLLALRDAVLSIDFASLTVSREPGEIDEADYRWASPSGLIPFDDYQDRQSGGRGKRQSLLDLIRDYPHEVADILEGYGYDADGLADEIGYYTRN